MLIAIGTILIFSPFANSVRTAGSIGMGEALIDVFRTSGRSNCPLRIDWWHLAHDNWHNLFLAFSRYRLNGCSDRIGRDNNRCASTSGT